MPGRRIDALTGNIDLTTKHHRCTFRPVGPKIADPFSRQLSRYLGRPEGARSKRQKRTLDVAALANWLALRAGRREDKARRRAGASPREHADDGARPSRTEREPFASLPPGSCGSAPRTRRAQILSPRPVTSSVRPVRAAATASNSEILRRRRQAPLPAKPDEARVRHPSPRGRAGSVYSAAHRYPAPGAASRPRADRIAARACGQVACRRMNVIRRWKGQAEAAERATIISSCGATLQSESLRRAGCGESPTRTAAMTDDRLPCWRSASIEATSSDKWRLRPPAISFSPFQNASSRLTLVLWPAMTMGALERQAIFILSSPVRPGADQDPGWDFRVARKHRDCARLATAVPAIDWRQRAFRHATGWPACAARSLMMSPIHELDDQSGM